MHFVEYFSPYIPQHYRFLYTVFLSELRLFNASAVVTWFLRATLLTDCIHASNSKVGQGERNWVVQMFPYILERLQKEGGNFKCY